MDRTLLSAVVACLLVCVAGVAGPDLLSQGDFEEGIGNWGYHQQDGAQGHVEVEDGAGVDGGRAAHITVENAGKGHHIQFMSSFPAERLQTGELYRLRLSARAAATYEFSVKLIGATRPWTNAGLSRDLQVGADWQEFEIAFRARRPDQENVKLDFFVGEQAGELWLDRVRIERLHKTELPKPEGPTLNAGNCRLRFSNQGAIMRMSHIKSGRRLIGGIDPRPLYRITLQQDGKETTVTNSDAYNITGGRTNTGLQFTFWHDGLNVICKITVAESGAVQFTAEIETADSAAVTGFEYPILRCPAKLGDSYRDDAVLYPRCDGGLIEQPLISMGGRGLADLYPGPLSCQVMAYYDETAGLYCATHDSSGAPKRFNCKLGVDLELSVTHLFPAVPDRDIHLQYPTVITAFTGDWYDAAGIYRNWSRKQDWCRMPIAEDGDTPDWVRRGAMVTCYNPRAKLKDGSRRFAPEGLRDFLHRLKEQYGLPVVANNRGWERHGTWTGQEYFPPFPGKEAFRRDARIISEHGGAGMIMLSGYRWTIEKRAPGGGMYSSADKFAEDVRPSVTYEPDGETPKIFESEKKGSWRGKKYARLCPATEFAKETVLDAAVRCVRAGYPVIHFDQEVSGPASTSLCYSKAHGHPPGYGRWMAEAMADLYRRIRASCEPLDRRFCLSMEEPNELFLPWLNLCQSRPNGLTNGFPIRRPMTRVVPLFSFLYHDYVIGWVAFYPWRSGGHPAYTLAKGFSAGMMPGLHWESTQRWDKDKRDAFNTLLRNCNEVYAGAGRKFLIFGKMLKPLRLDVPTRRFHIKGVPVDVRVPAVWNSVWELADGESAVILINPERQKHRLTIPPTGRTIDVPALDAVVHDL